MSLYLSFRVDKRGILRENNIKLNSIIPKMETSNLIYMFMMLNLKFEPLAFF